MHFALLFSIFLFGMATLSLFGFFTEWAAKWVGLHSHSLSLASLYIAFLAVVCEPFENCGRCIFSLLPFFFSAHSESAFSFHVFHCIFLGAQPQLRTAFSQCFLAFIHSNQGRRKWREERAGRHIKLKETATNEWNPLLLLLAFVLFSTSSLCQKQQQAKKGGVWLGEMLEGEKKSIKQLMANEWQALPLFPPTGGTRI